MKQFLGRAAAVSGLVLAASGAQAQYLTLGGSPFGNVPTVPSLNRSYSVPFGVPFAVSNGGVTLPSGFYNNPNGSAANPEAANAETITTDTMLARRLPRTSDSIEAKLEKDGRLFVQWSGEPRAVKQVTFALLDRNRKAIKSQVIRRLPVQTRFTLTAGTAYYRVEVEYLDGTTNSIVSPL